MASATGHRDENGGGMTSFAHQPITAGNRWKRGLRHQRIRSWQLCPDDIDKVE